MSKRKNKKASAKTNTPTSNGKLKLILIACAVLVVIVAITLILVFALNANDPNAPEGTVKHQEIGLTFYLPESFEKRNYSGYQHSYSDGDAEFLLAAISYQDLEEATDENGMPTPWPTTVYDYSRRFVIENSGVGFDMGLDDWQYDEAENVATIKGYFPYNGTEVEGMDDVYTHYIIMDNGEAIFFLTFSCEIESREIYEPLFDTWAAALSLKKYG